MKRIIGAILVIVTLFVLLGRLGSEDDDHRMTIEMWCYGSGGGRNLYADFWKETARKFERANPGVRVKIVADIPHSSYSSVLGTRFVAGSPPDVFIIDGGWHLLQMVNEDLLADLGPFIIKDHDFQIEDFVPAMADAGYVGGNCYSIPWCSAFACLYYRKDVLEKLSLSPPTTWDELIQSCLVLKKKAGLKYPFGVMITPRNTFWVLPFSVSNGARILSEDIKTVKIDNDEFIETLQFIHDLTYKFQIVDPKLSLGSTPRDVWTVGEAVMITDGIWVEGQYDLMFPHLKGKWNVAMIPSGKNGSVLCEGHYLVMSKHSKHPNLAWQFIAFATRAENQLRWSDVTGSPPANIRVIQMPEFKKNHPHMTSLMSQLVSRGITGQAAPYLGKIWYETFQNIVADRMMQDANTDIVGLARKAKSEMQRIVDDYWKTYDYSSYRIRSKKPKCKAK